MTISHAFARFHTDGQRAGSATVGVLPLPHATPATQFAVLVGGVALFLIGGCAVVMHGLSAVTAFH